MGKCGVKVILPVCYWLPPPLLKSKELSRQALVAMICPTPSTIELRGWLQHRIRKITVDHKANVASTKAKANFSRGHLGGYKERDWGAIYYKRR